MQLLVREMKTSGRISPGCAVLPEYWGFDAPNQRGDKAKRMRELLADQEKFPSGAMPSQSDKIREGAAAAPSCRITTYQKA